MISKRNNGHPSTLDIFMKGRTTFVFDLSDMRAELPTTLLKSKEDCPKADNKVVSVVDTELISRMEKIMNYLKPTKSKTKKKHRKEEEHRKPDERKEVKQEIKKEEIKEQPQQPQKKEVKVDEQDLLALGFLKPKQQDESDADR